MPCNLNFFQNELNLNNFINLIIFSSCSRQEAEMEKKIQASKEKSKTSIAAENLDKFTHLILEIEDTSINKHSNLNLAFACLNLN